MYLHPNLSFRSASAVYSSSPTPLQKADMQAEAERGKAVFAHIPTSPTLRTSFCVVSSLACSKHNPLACLLEGTEFFGAYVLNTIFCSV